MTLLDSFLLGFCMGAVAMLAGLWLYAKKGPVQKLDKTERKHAP